MYRKRLKKKVKNKIIQYKYYMRVEDQIDLLRELINVIIKLNNQLYKYKLKKNPKQENYISQRRPQFNH